MSRGSSGASPSTACAGSASTRAPTRRPLDALTPIATEAGPVALPIDWEAVSWLWSLDGYPSDPAHAQFAGKSLRGIRIWKVGGGAYDPVAAAEAARRQAGEFLAAVAERLRGFAAERGRRGLLVFAIDTELLGHWWSEGAIWLEEVVAGAEAAGVRLCTAPRALAEHEPVARPLAASTWGEAKDLRHMGLAGGRRHRLGRAAARAAPAQGACDRPAARGRRPRRARAARRAGERLGVPRRQGRGRRLRLPARHRARGIGPRGHKITQQWHRPAYALARTGPESRSPDGPLAQTDDRASSSSPGSTRR